MNERSVDRLLGLMDPAVALEVRALDGDAPAARAHLWREVRLRGQDAVREYLDRLFRALPSMHMRAEEIRGLPCWHSVVAELAGVDGDGLPYVAVAHIRIRGDGRSIRSMTVELVDIEVGPDLLSRKDRDPRRYFEAFLGNLNTTDAA